MVPNITNSGYNIPWFIFLFVVLLVKYSLRREFRYSTILTYNDKEN